MKTDFTCGFIGLGLIGGSIAHAMRKFYPACHLMAWDSNDTTLARAVEDGVINDALSSPNDHLTACDYLFLCAPVSSNISLIPKIKQYLSPTCLLTDVGSVKQGIHAQVKAVGLAKQFIGGHPMAGSERTGYINSRALLLENAYYVLTPSEEVPSETVQEFSQLIASLGAIPLVLSDTLHDYITAAVSHLPHVVAASLVHLIQQSDTPDELMKMIAAGGFKDITRIASSSPIMWQQICMTNTDNISSLLSQYIEVLSQMKAQIDNQNETEIYQFFDEARQYRDSFIDAAKGPIKTAYTLQLDIADQPGALASIVNLLASEDISIKNIGIVHNREQTDGVLQVEFHNVENTKKAISFLRANGYIVYEKN